MIDSVAAVSRSEYLKWPLCVTLSTVSPYIHRERNRDRDRDRDRDREKEGDIALGNDIFLLDRNSGRSVTRSMSTV